MVRQVLRATGRGFGYAGAGVVAFAIGSVYFARDVIGYLETMNRIDRSASREKDPRKVAMLNKSLEESFRRPPSPPWKYISGIYADLKPITE